MSDDEFFNEFGMTIDQAEIKLSKIKEENKLSMDDFNKFVDDKNKNQSTKDRLSWLIELSKRKEMIKKALNK